jgi:hypothetical protein
MLHWFLQDVSMARRALLAAIDDYERSILHTTPEEAVAAFERDVGAAFAKFVSPDPKAKLTIVTLIRVDNPRRARTYVRARFEHDFEARAWVERVFSILSWPFRLF